LIQRECYTLCSEALTKLFGRKKVEYNRTVRNKEEILLMNEEEQMNRWQQHFEEILNRKTNQYIREISDQSGEQNLKLKINTEIPTLNEIKMALKQTKNGRASGIDNINPEILTANIDTTASVLLPLFGKIWRQEKIPQDWKCGLIVKIPKKGDGTNKGTRSIVTLRFGSNFAVWQYPPLTF
jgi:hypothetical protein